MGWEIAAAGTVCFDDVTTPEGHRRGQLGGSAVYFSLAAAPAAVVNLCAVVGEDGEEALRAALTGTTVRLDDLEVVRGRTRRWYAVHDFERWVTASEHSDEGASGRWSGRLGGRALAAPVLFLGSMEPGQQLAALRAAPRRLVGSDSMIVHIGAASAAVHEVASGSDVLFLNRAELASLTGTAESDWRDAATGLVGRGRLRGVVVKAGPLGAACVTAAGVVEREAHLVERVVDPTGAGDSLAGGFLGHCAAVERDDDGVFEAALDAGLRRAAAAISDFGLAGLGAGAPRAPATGGRSAGPGSPSAR